jgi:hypothetical protein
MFGADGFVMHPTTSHTGKMRYKSLKIYTIGITTYGMYVPSFNSSIHSKVNSNWKGLRNGDGLSSTTTLHNCTLAILNSEKTHNVH